MSLALVPPPSWPAAPTSAGTLAPNLLVLRRRWLTLVLAMLLAPAVAALVLSVLPPRYTATGILLYDPVDAAPPGDAPADLGARLQDSVVASQAAIIASLPAARALAAALDLTADPEFNPALRRHLWDRWLPVHAPPGPDAVPEVVRQALEVTVTPGSDVLQVNFTSESPDLAAAGANGAMAIYLDRLRDEALAGLTTAETWLDGHEGALQVRLDKTEQALADARAAAGIVSGQQVGISTEAASRLAAALVDARSQLAMAQASLAAVGAGGGDADAASAAIAPNVLPLRQQAAQLAAQVNALAGQYGPSYPPLAADRAQLAAINGALAAETGRQLAAARAAVAADEAQVRNLTQEVAAAQQNAQALDVDNGPIRMLEQREAAQKTILQNMQLQEDQLAQQAALAKADASVLSAAAPPEAPSAPKRGQIMAASVMLGLCLGILLVQLGEGIDTTFGCGGDLRAHTGLPCFAVVPAQRRPLTAPLAAPLSLFSEQMRALRTALMAAGDYKVIAVTAARPGEGKTTLTVALGRMLALSGLSVVAVDGDVRQPGFEMIFRLAGVAGLTDCLAGLAQADDIVHCDLESPLHVIGAGSQTKEALSLFLSPALPALLASLRESYDVVLIDVPPAFALAEARVLARLADAALLCVRWASTPRQVVQAAILLLREAQVNIAGAALTRVHKRRHKMSGFPDAEMYQPRYGGYFRG
jgi:capsular exopolysaccharide synthesis family protein